MALGPYPRTNIERTGLEADEESLRREITRNINDVFEDMYCISESGYTSSPMAQLLLSKKELDSPKVVYKHDDLSPEFSMVAWIRGTRYGRVALMTTVQGASTFLGSVNSRERLAVQKEYGSSPLLLVSEPYIHIVREATRVQFLTDALETVHEVAAQLKNRKD